MSRPMRTVDFLNVPAETCQDLEELAAYYYNNDGTTCAILQSLGPYCGCSEFEEEQNGDSVSSACSFCSNGGDVPLPYKTLPRLRPDEIFPTGIANTFNVSCGLLQEVLRTHNASSEVCTQQKAAYEQECGCQENNSNPGEEQVPGRSGANAVESGTTTTSRCNLCVNGEEVPFPDRSLDHERISARTCGELESSIATLAASDQQCHDMQIFGHLCGCSKPPDATDCFVCPNGEPIPNPHHELSWTAGLESLPATFRPLSDTDDEMTCELLEAFVLYEPSYLLDTTGSGFVCLAVQLKSTACGCSPDWRQRFLTWAYRCSGFLSLVGSLLIIGDILKKANVRGTSFHQLVLGISSFDCVRSLAYLLSGLMAPANAGFPRPHGNNVSCSVQGFMIQLGLASIFYDLCLAGYFYLVIKHNWRERQFKRYLMYIHIMLLIIGLSFACSAIPYYGPKFGLCHLNDEPFATNSWKIVTILYAVPVAVVTFGVTWLNASICVRVYSTQKNSKKWSINQSMELTRKVFWQSFLYVAAFYFTVPFVLLSYYAKYSREASFWMFAVAAVMAPAHGLMNALVYFNRSNRKVSSEYMVLMRSNAKKFTNRVSMVWRRRSSKELGGSGHTKQESGLEITTHRRPKAEQKQIQDLRGDALSRRDSATPEATSMGPMVPCSPGTDIMSMNSGEENILVLHSKAGFSQSARSLGSTGSNGSAGSNLLNFIRRNRQNNTLRILKSRIMQPQLPLHTDLMDDDFGLDGNVGERPEDIEEFEATMEYWRLNFLAEDPSFHFDDDDSDCSAPHHHHMFFRRKQWGPVAPSADEDPLSSHQRMPTSLLRSMRARKQAGSPLLRQVVPVGILGGLLARRHNSRSDNEGDYSEEQDNGGAAVSIDDLLFDHYRSDDGSFELMNPSTAGSMSPIQDDISPMESSTEALASPFERLRAELMGFPNMHFDDSDEEISFASSLGMEAGFPRLPNVQTDVIQDR